MNYEIHVKQVAPQVVATERRHTVLAELGKVMHQTLAAIERSVEPAGAARGAPFAIYYNEPFDPADIDVEMGLPIAGEAKLAGAAGVERRDLPGGPVAFTVHAGPYESIGAAYAALYDWVKQHGHQVLGPPREIYLRGPGPGTSPADFRTEIDVPID